uniref:Uncharacterized protein n=1 Tax=Rhizophora mucronata TaxID=61149 RepID=A0A2P2MFQ6_RHIMU
MQGLESMNNPKLPQSQMSLRVSTHLPIRSILSQENRFLEDNMNL